MLARESGRPPGSARALLGYPAGVSEAVPAEQSTPLRPIAAVVAALQGLVLLANALAVAVIALRDGVHGPSAVATPTGVMIEVGLYALFGLALLWIAQGISRGSGAALTPFLLAQLLGLTVSIPLAMGDGQASIIGWAITASCLLGLAAWVGLLRNRGA